MILYARFSSVDVFVQDAVLCMYALYSLVSKGLAKAISTEPAEKR